VGRGLTPTPRAKEIAAQLPRALDALGLAIAPPEAFDPRTSTRAFRIATLDYFELTALPALLQRLRQQAPGIGLEIERFSPGHLGALAAGELDLALVGEAMKLESGGVKRRVLFEEPFRVIARPDHPEIGRRLDLATYTRLGHVLVSVEGRREGVVDRALAPLGLSRRVALRVPHFTTAPLAVLSSDWICTVAKTVAERATAVFGVRNMAPPLVLPTPSLIALWPRRLDTDTGSLWFRDLVIRRVLERR
jgi:DNA-binding transcriptional LysR family regulator